MYIDLYRSALLHRHHKNTNLFIDSTSIFSSAPSGEMSSEFGILPTWLAYKSGVRDNLPVLCIMLPCITSHCRLALLMARRFFSWRTKNRKQIKYSFRQNTDHPFQRQSKVIALLVRFLPHSHIIFYISLNLFSSWKHMKYLLLHIKLVFAVVPTDKICGRILYPRSRLKQQIINQSKHKNIFFS